MHKSAIIILLLLTNALPSLARQKGIYRSAINKAAEHHMNNVDAAIARWKVDVRKSDLFGYSPTSYPAMVAELLGHMYQTTGDKRYARKALSLLLIYEDLKKAVPKSHYADRIEYQGTLPPISNFFSMYSYPAAWSYIRDSGVASDQQRRVVEKGIADCANFVLTYPEWGPMNRAILRAETFYFAADLLPQHENRKTWQKMAAQLSDASWQRWQEEDATSYHAVWLMSLLRVADMRKDSSLFESAIPRYYFDYFANLMTPAGLIADFGDSGWPTDRMRFLATFEKAAAVYQQPEFKWVAERLWQTHQKVGRETLAVHEALALVQAERWCDENMKARQPSGGSRLVMEDIVGKKVVFKSGVGDNDTFLLLNYRDEGDGAFAGREFLRSSITAEEEKTHHGNSDENSIVSLMHNGSVLLHDAGYRDQLASGEYGRFRADYFHNRVVSRMHKRHIPLLGDEESQPVWEFLRNAGSYRPVQTQLIEFHTFREVDYSRTRVIDPELGTTWDRVLVWHKEDGYFIVFDIVRADKPGFRTHTALWHTRNIASRGDNWFDTEIDSVRNWKNPPGQRLLIYFPLAETIRERGTFALRRNWQNEIAIYESLSDHYYAGDYAVFVSVLVPHAANQPVAPLLNKFELLKPDQYPRAIGVQVSHQNTAARILVKADLQLDYAPQNARPRYAFEHGHIRAGELATDANFLYLRHAGDRGYFAASNLTRIDYQGQTIHQSRQMAFGLQPDGGPIRPGRPKWRAWEDDFKP